jgi:RNA polymerase sigma factor (sigma-70 family)
MADRPAELARLLASTGPEDRDAAWTSLVRTQSDLLLRVARFYGGGHDAVMDRYAYILEQLQRDAFTRLRSFQPEERGSFEVWLVAVARRLCLDHLRQKYGRPRVGPARDQRAALERSRRRRLVDLVGESLEVTRIPDATRQDPAQDLAAKELRSALEVALAALEHRDRLLLRLLFEEDLTAREVARLMGFPTLFHVYRRRNQVLAMLRLQLQEKGVREAEP